MEPRLRGILKKESAETPPTEQADIPAIEKNVDVSGLGEKALIGKENEPEARRKTFGGRISKSPRKSTGRRVSFAATAHVRLFDDQTPGGAVTRGGEDEEEEEEEEGLLKSVDDILTPLTAISTPQVQQDKEEEEEEEKLTGDYETRIKGGEDSSSSSASTDSLTGIRVLNDNFNIFSDDDDDDDDDNDKDKAEPTVIITRGISHQLVDTADDEGSDMDLSMSAVDDSPLTARSDMQLTTIRGKLLRLAAAKDDEDTLTILRQGQQQISAFIEQKKDDSWMEAVEDLTSMVLEEELLATDLLSLPSQTKGTPPSRTIDGILRDMSENISPRSPIRMIVARKLAKQKAETSITPIRNLRRNKSPIKDSFLSPSTEESSPGILTEEKLSMADDILLVRFLPTPVEITFFFSIGSAAAYFERILESG